MTGVGLIGFGRVGRGLLRELHQRRLGLEVRAVCELNPRGREPGELVANLAYLLKHDSTSGALSAPVSARGQVLLLDQREIPVFLDRAPGQVDWAGLGVGVLVEASGDPRAADQAAALAGGAVDRVLITRSAQPAQVTLVPGVNLSHYDPRRHRVVSCSTCTANAAAPVLMVLDRDFGIRRASLISVHPALSGDTILDAPHPLFAAGRSGLGLRPVPSQAARTTAQVLPRLEGRLMAMTLRVPTPVVNALMVDAVLSRPPGDGQAVISALERAAGEELAGIMALERGFMNQPRVAVDFAGSRYSALVDLNWLALEGPLLRLLIWHDNETAYCARVADILETVAAQSS